jgi:hypothetical protein
MPAGICRQASIVKGNGYLRNVVNGRVSRGYGNGAPSVDSH